MYADLDVAAVENRQALMIPRVAVQNINDRRVVYVATSAGSDKFIEREVRLGDASGEDVEVLAGVQPGDRVVAKAAYFFGPNANVLGVSPGRA
jgi:multidrug efflux pump subunit AcrA (membrane-fusion protein)